MNIYKIAEETGLSASTVARALNGNGYCSEKSKRVIFEAAQKLNYSPNLSARALRNNRTERILFCIPDICNPFYFKMIQGANAIFEANGYYAMLCSTEHSLEKELKMIELIKQKYCDGMIMVSFNFCDENILAVRKSNCPVVLTNRYLEQDENDNFDYVYLDHIYGMRLATQHLIEQGCKKILIVLGNIKEQTSMERLQGYIKALQSNNIEMDYNKILNGGYTNQGAYDAFAKYIESGGEFDGIIASNDLAACGIVKFCNENGIKIPEDVKLVSFDNTDFAVAGNPSFTSIDMKQYEIGQNAATLLLDRINGRQRVSNVTLKPELIIRNSSKKIEEKQ